MHGQARAALLQHGRAGDRLGRFDQVHRSLSQGLAALRGRGDAARHLHPLQRPREADDVVDRGEDADRQDRRAGRGPRRERHDPRQAVRGLRRDDRAGPAQLHQTRRLPQAPGHQRRGLHAHGAAAQREISRGPAGNPRRHGRFPGLRALFLLPCAAPEQPVATWIGHAAIS